MASKTLKVWKTALFCGAAILAIGLVGGVPSLTLAQTHTEGTHETGDHGSGHDMGTGHDDGGMKGGQKRKGRGTMDSGERGSLRDVFRDMEDEAAADAVISKGKGKKSLDSKSASETSKGKKTDKVEESAESAEDSDRPEWAGISGKEGKPGQPNQESGTKKGDIYGDLYVVVRDVNGVPILDADGNVQVYYIDPTTKVLTCCIPRDAEGNLLPTLADGTPVLPTEVELGRLSVGRSPTRVLSAQYEEALSTINSATSVDGVASIALDAAGRIVVTLADGTTKTIDSPLENLALYVELLNTGTLSGVIVTLPSSLSFLTDGTLTTQDLQIAASLFAAASDKSVTVTVDSIEYMNSILSIDGTLPADFVDYSTFTYDRSAIYSNLTVDALVLQPDGTYKVEPVNVYDAVFSSTPLTADNVAAFTAATDDARLVIDYLHNYAPPET